MGYTYHPLVWHKDKLKIRAVGVLHAVKQKKPQCSYMSGQDADGHWQQFDTMRSLISAP